MIKPTTSLQERCRASREPGAERLRPRPGPRGRLHQLRTENALEARLFTVKDAIAVIDDYAPNPDSRAQQELEKRAQRRSSAASGTAPRAGGCGGAARFGRQLQAVTLGEAGVDVGPSANRSHSFNASPVEPQRLLLELLDRRVQRGGSRSVVRHCP